MLKIKYIILPRIAQDALHTPIVWIAVFHIVPTSPCSTKLFFIICYQKTCYCVSSGMLLKQFGQLALNTKNQMQIEECLNPKKVRTIYRAGLTLQDLPCVAKRMNSLLPLKDLVAGRRSFRSRDSCSAWDSSSVCGPQKTQAINFNHTFSKKSNYLTFE